MVIKITTVQGYYDGTAVRPLEQLAAKPNQKVIITVIDEFVEPVKNIGKKGIRGILSRYANPELVKEEKGAWERSAVKKYGDA